MCFYCEKMSVFVAVSDYYAYLCHRILMDWHGKCRILSAVSSAVPKNNANINKLYILHK